MYLQAFLFKVYPRLSKFVSLSDEREMESQSDRLLETIENPEYVQEGDAGALLAIRHYATTPLTSKYLVVVYRELSPDDGFILTAYLTRKPSRQRKIIWKP